MDHFETYQRHRQSGYGRAYARTVGRFQEGFLRDKVCTDLDAAWERAIEATERLVPVIKMTAGRQ